MASSMAVAWVPLPAPGGPNNTMDALISGGESNISDKGGGSRVTLLRPVVASGRYPLDDSEGAQRFRTQSRNQLRCGAFTSQERDQRVVEVLPRGGIHVSGTSGGNGASRLWVVTSGGGGNSPLRNQRVCRRLKSLGRNQRVVEVLRQAGVLLRWVEEVNQPGVGAGRVAAELQSLEDQVWPNRVPLVSQQH